MFLGHLREVVRRNIEVYVELFNVEEMDASRKKEVRHVEGWVIKKDGRSIFAGRQTAPKRRMTLKFKTTTLKGTRFTQFPNPSL